MNKIKTVIAAGGLGTRLQGFRGNESTKILLEVDGKPMIIRQIEQLIDWGLENFIIITNPSFDELIKDVISSYYPDKNISFTIQHEQKGISHALMCAEKYILPGKTAVSAIQLMLENMKNAGLISSYDKYIGEKIAYVLSGGETDITKELLEENILKLEKSTIYSLMSKNLTIERLEHILDTGKYLRN